MFLRSFLIFLKTIFNNNEKYFHNSDFSIKKQVCQLFSVNFRKIFKKLVEIQVFSPLADFHLLLKK